ncbi:GIY-YIG nuclease family protein [Bradyrhizobium sp. 4]|uniref:hypothetical protein n=1 Tax=unclassified Bradyrhizobium TaxID=2631580 RepID=UPI001FF87118|nr:MULTISPECIES: hypothetical protein [unclassified Bradyrhizobium]MCK1397022.1 GIY-YIG nuclease family protein [Bradyrhizobium sp. 39]MCK1630247.1 GIY-YIG nuclease family protein [Bradyrhizobium sp. 162]MCK1751380.1 GIY-YIG nuclease family protein [Bradyrhizobium sp. 135]UPJ36271.1 GIY-YIG nuclease family protein [Bradyrhizobium sp. 4]
MPVRAYDIVDLTERYKADSHGFFLNVKRWKKFKSKHRLDWQKTRFEAANVSAIPSERGIYAFTLELSPTKLPAHGYIMYVGITGNTSSSNLRRRYAQYLRELSDPKGRPRVVFMLNKWNGDLFFNFVPLPKQSVDLDKLEKAMLDAIIPPINQRDFNAEIASARKAAF